MNTYEIKINQFEGPFDLLLFFIERDELNIHEIPISKITDDFLNYIQNLTSLNIEVASDFILMASTLMRIKAQTLLPQSTNDVEEEIDMKEELVQKLILYKHFKNISKKLKILEDARCQLHPRGNITIDIANLSKLDTIEEDLSTLNLYKLLLNYQRTMDRHLNRTQEIKHTVVKYPYTIEEQKKIIKNLMQLSHKIDFSLILFHSENKVQFVYNFLAILELLQQQVAKIEMGLGYNDFSIYKKH